MSTLKIRKLFDIVDGSSPDPTPLNVNSYHGNFPEYLIFLLNQRWVIEQWKYCYDLACEATIKAPKLEDYFKVITSSMWASRRNDSTIHL